MKNFLTVFLIFIFSIDLNAKIIYTEPVKNAEYVSINNNIIIGFDETIKDSDLNSIIIVSGSRSGYHSGETIITKDKDKLLFQPHQPFFFDEEVTVKINNIRTSRTLNNKLTYTFHTQISKPDKSYFHEFSQSNNFPYPGDYAVLPALTVTVYNNPSPGNIFLNNLPNLGYSPNIRITRNNGTTAYSRELNTTTLDFKRQPNGLIVYFKVFGPEFYGPGMYYAEDSGFNIVDSFYCGNGYITDGHEMRLLDNGHAFVIADDPQPVDMSLVVPGGNPNAIVEGFILQEIDENKNVVFQWRSWEHFNITDAIYEDLTANVIDYVHGNAVELDHDGNILISSRHLNEITKIDRSTGDIIWRLGGVNNEFTFINETVPFHYQHDIRRLDNGNITLYDNGNHRTPSFSRAVEYSLDEINKTATLVWQYRNTPDIYGPLMGSAQRLRNGNTLIGWGGANTTLTEVTPSGNIALEMKYPAGIWSYRVFKDEVNLTLNLKLAIEGIYNPSSNTLNIRDTVRAFIRSSVSPYIIIDSAKGVIDSMSMTGNFRFYNISTGNYYISIQHRNGLETWSETGGETFIMNGVYLYDFTDSGSKAYGGNLILKGSKYCIYSGDVDHDGYIDLGDLISLFNEASSFTVGFEDTDIDGNNFVDLVDLLIVNNNANSFIVSVKP